MPLADRDPASLRSLSHQVTVGEGIILDLHNVSLFKQLHLKLVVVMWVVVVSEVSVALVEGVRV